MFLDNYDGCLVDDWLSELLPQAGLSSSEVGAVYREQEPLVGLHLLFHGLVTFGFFVLLARASAFTTISSAGSSLCYMGPVCGGPRVGSISSM